jgi:hypothetical protein
VTLRTSRVLPASALRWFDERANTAAGEAQVRVGLIRMALRRRENIPELAVLALEREGLGKRDLELEAGR